MRVAGLGCATVTEESLLNLITVNGKGLMLGAVRSQAAAILVNILIAS